MSTKSFLVRRNVFVIIYNNYIESIYNVFVIIYKIVEEDMTEA